MKGMSMKISVKLLAPVTLTRKRGAEAFEALHRYLKSNTDVNIDLDATEMLSLSFLDELVVRLSDADLLRKAAFVTQDPATMRKLGIIAQERNLTLYRRRTETDTTLRSVPRLRREIRTPKPEKRRA
jgi:hypothetical protein